MKNSDRQPDLFDDTPNSLDASALIAFYGTDNPRELRVLRALLVGPLKREQLDSVAGCSNGPQLASNLRGKGLGNSGLLCTMTTGTDRDGKQVTYGMYSLTANGHRVVSEWLAKIGSAEVRYV